MKTKIKHMVAASLAMCTLSTGIGELTSNAIKNTNTDDYYSKDEDVDITLLKYIEDNNIDADLVEFLVMEDQGFNDSEMITNLLQIREMLTGYIKDNDLPARVISNEEVPDEIAESFVSIEYYYKDENVHITLLKYIEDNNIDADLVEFSVAEIEDEFVKGDINADGKFTVADVVMLQKWLLGTPDATLSNWKSADLCEDGTLNAFDLCMMKKELLRKADVKTEIEFISTDKLRDYGLDHEEWKGFIAFSNNDFEAIIKNNEGEYTQSKLPEDVFNENAILVVYSQIGASNKYSIIDDISISDNTIVVSSTTKEPTIATPDMSYRRYIYIVDKNAVSKECVFSFNDSSSYFDYEEGNEVANWFKEWENRNK